MKNGRGGVLLKVYAKLISPKETLFSLELHHKPFGSWTLPGFGGKVGMIEGMGGT